MYHSFFSLFNILICSLFRIYNTVNIETKRNPFSPIVFFLLGTKFLIKESV